MVKSQNTQTGYRVLRVHNVLFHLPKILGNATKSDQNQVSVHLKQRRKSRKKEGIKIRHEKTLGSNKYTQCHEYTDGSWVCASGKIINCILFTYTVDWMSIISQ